jgi:hypothetical protein
MTLAQLITHDKALHALGGAVLFAGARGAALVLGSDAGTARIIAMAVALAAAIGKEIYDARHRDTHTPDPLDAAFTMAGALLACSCTFGNA